MLFSVLMYLSTTILSEKKNRSVEKVAQKNNNNDHFIASDDIARVLYIVYSKAPDTIHTSSEIENISSPK